MVQHAAGGALDIDYLIREAQALARVSTAVPLGFDTLIADDHPLLVHYVQEVVRPKLDALGLRDLIDVGNNLVVRFGKPNGNRALILQNYTVTQHHNHMAEPFSGKIANARDYGYDEPCVFGQGVSQNKAHQAVMLAVLKHFIEAGIALDGCLYWVVNNEGRSTHDCTRAVLARIGRKPDFGIVQLGTGLKVWLGNRGRVDIDVHVHGKSAHSSTPEHGLSAIDGANEVINRLKRLDWPDRHDRLGGRQAIVYKIRYEPLAPHTLPSDAFLTIDRRLLPGDDPTAAVEEVRATIGDLAPFEIEVAQGVTHLPALVERDEPSVRAFLETARATGPELQTVHVGSAFDAGGLTSAGIPAVTFGAGAGIYPVGPDFVPIAQLRREAELLLRFIRERLG
jgi:acetylornithine deacetylase/succinyl-diaminopimelate desuccinylase-like protein